MKKIKLKMKNMKMYFFIYLKLLKGFKKSLETEINQSSLFYEKSIQVIKQLNESK